MRSPWRASHGSRSSPTAHASWSTSATRSRSTGAGRAAEIDDDEYEDAGATLTDDPLPGATVVLSVQPLARDRIRQLHAGASLVSFLPTAQALDQVRDMRDCGLTAYSLEQVPRISRAQSMDALSSQALVAGYRSAIVAAGILRASSP